MGCLTSVFFVEILIEDNLTKETQENNEIIGDSVIQEEVEIEDFDEVLFEYSIKIINPDRMSEFKNVRVSKWKQCETLEDLRLFLTEKVPSVSSEPPDFSSVDLGYLEPGHGMKGKKQWFNNDDDVNEMYAKHAGRRNIQLWAYSRVKSSGKKRESSYKGIRAA